MSNPRPDCLTGADVKMLLTRSGRPRRCSALEEHLTVCPRCREEMTEQQEFEQIRQSVAPTDPPRPVVHGYRVEELLGWGGCGQVWKAFRDGLAEPRVLKVLRPELFGPEALALLRREANTMQALKWHRNRVPLLDLIEQDGRVVLVMPFVAGGPLHRLAPLPWERAVRYVADAADGLLPVHAAGLLHRDVKPHNLLRDAAEDVALLTDFGLAARADRQTFGGCTYGYAAAEAIEGRAEAASDVFGLAATLFFLIAGRPPFPTGDRTLSLAAVRHGLPATVPELAALPRSLEQLLRAGLAPKPARTANAGGVRGPAAAYRPRRAGGAVTAAGGGANGPGPAGRDGVAIDPQGRSEPVLACSNRDAESPPPARLRTGDIVRVEIRADQDGHLTMLNFGSSGRFRVVVPGVIAKETRLGPDRPQALKFRLDTASGRDEMAVLWTRGAGSGVGGGVAGADSDGAADGARSRLERSGAGDRGDTPPRLGRDRAQHRSRAMIASRSRRGNIERRPQVPESDEVQIQIGAAHQQVVRLYQQGRYREALELAQQVSELARIHLGEGHRDFAATLNSLARCTVMGDYARAEPLFSRAWRLSEN